MYMTSKKIFLYSVFTMNAFGTYKKIITKDLTCLRGRRVSMRKGLGGDMSATL